MSKNKDEDLPPVVREIKRETEDMILQFDQAFLHKCGILWERDITGRPRAGATRPPES